MTQARETRIRRGMGAEDAAKRLHVTAAYLLRCERFGFPYCLARRAERVYCCPIDHFLQTAGKPPVIEPREAGGAKRPGK